VPCIPGLTNADILEFALQSKPVQRHVPDLEDWVHVDRKWLCDMLYTLDTDSFQRLIVKSLAARRKVVEVKAKEMVGIRAEFAQALSRSVVCSQSKSFPFIQV
jgi:hypothetical protein